MTIRKIGPAGIPSLGLGTFRMNPGEAREMTLAALAEGYRHIDTAQAYENEAEVGEGLRASPVPRSEVFVTTKILPKDFAPGDFRIHAYLIIQIAEADGLEIVNSGNGGSAFYQSSG